MTSWKVTIGLSLVAMLSIIIVIVMAQVNIIEEPAQKTDVFQGIVTSAALAQGEFAGTGAYDRNCLPVAGGLTKCDAGIETEKYGLINLQYTHNMAKAPCIAPGDQLKVSILDGSGNAKVTRSRF